MVIYGPATGEERAEEQRLQRKQGGESKADDGRAGSVRLFPEKRAREREKERQILGAAKRVEVTICDARLCRQGRGKRYEEGRGDCRGRCQNCCGTNAGWECTNVQRCREDAKTTAKKLTGLLAAGLPKDVCACVRACLCVYQPTEEVEKKKLQEKTQRACVHICVNLCYSFLIPLADCWQSRETGLAEHP